MVSADIAPTKADLKANNLVDDIFEWRRPELYGVRLS